MTIKANVTTNVQHNNWSGLSHHVKRTQFNNDDVDLTLTKYNRYSDGKIVFDKGFNPRHPSLRVYPKGSVMPIGLHFKYNKNFYRIKHYENSLIRRHANKNGWLKNHNRKAIRQGHKKRVITPKQLFYGRGKNRHNPTQTITVSFGSANSNINNKCINLIQHAYKRGKKEAFKRYIKTMSLANANVARLWNAHHKHVKILHWGTNSDERQSQSSKSMNAQHLHAQIIGLGWSSLDKHGNPNRYKSGKRKGKLRGKPSFSVSKALELEYHTGSNIEAMKRFRDDEDHFALSIYQRTLAKHFSRVSAFKQPFILTRTHSKNTGRSMTQYKHDEALKDKINSLHQQLDKIKRHHNQIKPLSKHNQHKISSASSSANHQAKLYSSGAKSMINHRFKYIVSSISSNQMVLSSTNYALSSLTSAKSSMSNSLIPLKSNYISLSDKVDGQNAYLHATTVPKNADNLYTRLPDNNSRLVAYGRFRYGSDRKAPTLSPTFQLDSKPKHIRAKLLIESSVTYIKNTVASHLPSRLTNWAKRYYIKVHDKLRGYATKFNTLFHKYDRGWLMSHAKFTQDNSIYLGHGASILGHKYDKRIDGMRKDITPSNPPTPISSASSASNQSINKWHSMQRSQKQQSKASQLSNSVSSSSSIGRQ